MIVLKSTIVNKGIVQHGAVGATVVVSSVLLLRPTRGTRVLLSAKVILRCCTTTLRAPRQPPPYLAHCADAEATCCNRQATPSEYNKLFTRKNRAKCFRSFFPPSIGLFHAIAWAMVELASDSCSRFACPYRFV